ncbi:MAG: tRNA preQ1(34) S-adenosylmethionine ribosyltransferase-isomerase QueA [Candidatus Omnitrophica bacterium]|nr:tRNA preQ1(34) S-adenosylmethionine ribosyltransferase-isomerase QueA [Candidatus Omnitrophota bacterium]
MKLSEFDYTLPKELIAQYPLKQRDRSRLLVLHRESGEIEHRTFRDLFHFLHQQDTLVLNDTKVRRARLFGRKETGGRIEALLLRSVSPSTYEALLNPSASKIGSRILFDQHREAEVVGGNGIVKTIRFQKGNVMKWLRQKGTPPLPPYIRRLPDREDIHRYQTVYARKEGAVAAPTAGLHFTKPFLRKIEAKGVCLCGITLHVGYGTFEPVRSEEIEDHKMHEEYFELSSKAARILNETKKKGGRIIAVGTTSCRVLETSIKGVVAPGVVRGTACGAQRAPLRLALAFAPPRLFGGGDRARSGSRHASHHNQSPPPFCSMRGWTDLFIYPPYEFLGTDALLTNFHLPKSTLFMLVSAFAGIDLIRKAYEEAIRQRYRFYSYGDAMLIL